MLKTTSTAVTHVVRWFNVTDFGAVADGGKEGQRERGGEGEEGGDILILARAIPGRLEGHC